MLSLSDADSKIASVNVDFSDGKTEIAKSPPVKLKNCFLAKPFEFYTEMYGVRNITKLIRHSLSLSLMSLYSA